VERFSKTARDLRSSTKECMSETFCYIEGFSIL
jgi:hypothetical protein